MSGAGEEAGLNLPQEGVGQEGETGRLRPEDPAVNSKIRTLDILVALASTTLSSGEPPPCHSEKHSSCHCAIKRVKDFKGKKLAEERSKLEVEMSEMPVYSMIRTFDL
ncbi:hypothetical protein ElyMa_004850700 [Elysia marginata]|uniref:Uncharacterized protein n=1 Tax=Elysia marginata TaxID=1093978 RepID=A0AAV4ISU5_9GAST|nr:hypothetical protein ElyMa_004850700 [Elysia marginata]